MKPFLMRALLFVFVLAGFFSLPARGQQDDTPTMVTDSNRSGDLPYSATVGTPTEHVEISSGGLVVSIPILHVKGRGMDFTYALQYDSHGIGIEPRQTVNSLTYIWNFELRNYLNNQGLWSSNQPFLTSTRYSKTQCYVDPNDPKNGLVTGTNNFMFQDETGGKHSLLANFERATECIIGNGWIINNSGPDSGAQGIWALASSHLPGVDVGSVLMNDGTSITDGGFLTSNVAFPGTVQRGFGFFTDANGNSKTEAPGGFDTLGRNLISQQTSANQIVYTVSASDGTTQNYTVNLANFPVSTTFGVSGVTEYSGTRVVISSIVLPNGQSYSMFYNNNGELKQLTLPTGAVITYNYATASNGVCSYRYVSSRSVNIDGQVANWGFSVTPGPCIQVDQAAGKTITVTDPLQNQSVYTVDSLGNTNTAAIYQGTATGTPLRLYTITYKDPTSGTGANTEALVGSITTQLDNGLMSRKEFDYDSFSYPSTSCPTGGLDCTNNGPTTSTNFSSRGNVTEIREFDWGTSAASLPLVRRTDKTYLHDSNSAYVAPNIVSKVLQDTVYDGGNNQLSQTQYEYDNYVAGDNPMQGTSGVAEHDNTGHTTAFTLRGNATRVKRLRNTDGALLTTTYTYDDLGNIRAIKDPLNHATSYDYTDNFANGACPPPSSTQAYVSTVTNALGQMTKISRYPCTGLVQAHQDQNDINAGRAGTTYLYEAMGRVKQKNLPDGGVVSTSYNDATAPLSVTTNTTLSSAQGAAPMTSVAILDGMGRTKQTQLTSDPQGTDFTDTQYDLLGRKSTVSNPYRSTSDPTYGITTTLYDALGRACLVVPPDGTLPTGSSCPATQPANTVFTAYSGNATTVTDQANMPRRSVSDALGRLIEVDEPGGVTSASPGQGTATVSGTELSIGGAAPTPATGSATASGSERSIPGVAAAAGSGSATFSSASGERNIPGTSAAPGKGSVQLSSLGEKSVCLVTIPGKGCTSRVFDAGKILITFSSGFQASASYGQNIALATIVSNLNSGLNGTGSPVTASISGSTINMTAIATGAASNYTFSAQSNSNDPKDFPTPSVTISASGPALTGGTDATPTTYDSGTVTVTLNGTPYQVSYGQNSTTSSVASALASAITAGTLANATATASGISITAKTTGSATNYTLSCSSVTGQAGSFGANTTSFPFSPACATALTGGKDAIATTYDSGTVTVTINGTPYQVSYGQNDTPTTVATALAGAISKGTLASATSNGAAVSITTTATGSATNFSLACSSVTGQAGSFGANTTSFPFSPACAAKLSGGKDAGPVVYDTGTVTLTINGTPYQASYGQNDNPGTIATALAGAINQGTLATATPSGSSISLTAKATGSASNYTVLTSSVSSQPASFPTPSFSASSGNLSGGTNATAGSLATPAVTLYTYNALGNLTCAVQKGTDTSAFTTCAAAPATWRPRSFTYDSLSELLSSNNPETGTISYTYNNDGTVATKTAPAPNQTGAATVGTTFSYDALSRITQKSFSDGATPPVTYTYDVSGLSGLATTNMVGRLAEQGIGSPCCSVFELFSYDPIGRTILDDQNTPAMGSKPVSYTYDLAGNMASYSDGVGITFTQGINSAGRATQLTSSLVDAQHPATLVSGVTYTPGGAISQMTFGNGLAESDAYNNRLQPTQYRTYNPSTGANTLNMTYGFNAGVADNGDVVTMAATGAQTFSRTYSYDGLDRLSSMSSPSDPSGCTGLAWGYDVWGNRTNQTVTGGSCFQQPPTAFSAKNQLPAPYQYDAAGNVTYDGSHSYTYDAENRLVSVDHGAATYLYDAEGRRVEKAANGAKEDYIYNLSGQVVSEYLVNSTFPSGVFYLGYNYLQDAFVSEYSNGTTYFVHKDHLGSTRLLTKLDQSLFDNMDYLPYGEQIAGASGTSHKFTGKERDPESGLDDFGARYYASPLGRFMSPDWNVNEQPVPYAKFENPQTLNLYAYLANNPLRTIDPDGHADSPCEKNDVGCKVTYDNEHKTATLVTIKTETVLKDANGNVVTNAKDATTSTTTTTIKSITVSTELGNGNGQVLGGKLDISSSTVDLGNPAAGVQTSPPSSTDLNPLQATQAFDGTQVSALKDLVSPSVMDRLNDHKVGVGGVIAGGGIAIVCVLSVGCGVAVAVGGIAVATGAALYDMATH